MNQIPIIPSAIVEALKNPDVYALRLAHRNGKWEAQIELAQGWEFFCGSHAEDPSTALDALASRIENRRIKNE